MPFQKGHKFGKGGRRKNAGRPSKAQKAIKLEASKIARAYLEKHIGDVLKTAKLLVTGVKRRRHNPKTGAPYYEIEYDGSQVRHWIDKFVPSAKQELEISGGIKIVKVDAFDPDGSSRD